MPAHLHRGREKAGDLTGLNKWFAHKCVAEQSL